MGSTSGIVLVMNFICLCVGMAGIIAGGVGHSWWKLDTTILKRETGLWRSCVTSKQTDQTICGKSRNDVLEFDVFEDLDIVLIILIGACFFAFVSLISAASMFCCQNSRSGWRCGSIMVTIMSLLSAAATLVALIYAEIEIEWTVNTERGWSVIATWIGAAMCLFSFIVSMILCCLLPRSSHASYGGDGYAMR